MAERQPTASTAEHLACLGRVADDLHEELLRESKRHGEPVDELAERIVEVKTEQTARSREPAQRIDDVSVPDVRELAGSVPLLVGPSGAVGTGVSANGVAGPRC